MTPGFSPVLRLKDKLALAEKEFVVWLKPGINDVFVPPAKADGNSILNYHK
jgi:hypothetical protein